MNSFCKDDDCCCDDAIRRILINNTGKVVIVFTKSGGCSGEGFTGLVATICDDAVKLVTTLPSAPPYPFVGSCKSGRHSGEFSLCCNRHPSHFGSAVYIPLCQITSVVVAEV